VRRGWIVGVTVLTAVACTGTPPVPPPLEPRPQQSKDAAGPVYAYADAHGLIRVMRGRDQVAAVEPEGDNRPGDEYAIDADWAADGSRFVATTNKRLVSVDVRAGTTTTIRCDCGNVALAGGRVYTAKDNATELATYNAVTLGAESALPVKLGRARGIERVDGAGDRLVVFLITGSGARTQSDVAVLDPATGDTTTVGDSIAVAESGYTPRGWRGGPMFAYLVTGSTGAQSGEAEVRWFDPTRPAREVVTDNEPLRAATPGIPPNEWNSGRDHLWWAADGTLRTTAWTWSCRQTAPLDPPSCVDRVPHTQWRYDGTEWAMVDRRNLGTAQSVGDWSVELSTPAKDGGLDQRLTAKSPRGEPFEIAGSVRRLWTPPQLATPPPKRAGRQDIAQRLAPLVWLHKDETDFPTDTANVVRNSTLKFDHGDLCTDAPDPVAATVEEAKLASDPYEVRAGVCGQERNWQTYRTNQPPNLGKDNGKGFYLDFSDDGKVRHGNTPDEDGQVHAPVYWDYHDPDDSGRDAYLFWFFYAYDDYTANHESDWEHIAVQVDGDRPVGVTFFRHEIPPCFVPWEYVERSGERPVVYAAQGAHGSYPRIGDYPRYDKKQWGTDHTGKDFPWDTSREVFNVTEQPWYGYRGLWGQLGRFDFTTGKAGPYPGRNLAGAMTTDKCPDEPPQLPADFVGTWKTTTVTDSTAANPYGAELTLTTAASGQSAGTATYPGLGCGGGLILRDATPDTVILSELRSPAPQLICANTGTVTLTKSATGLHYTYNGDNRPGTATAELARQ
jgi:hypothetical protein